jgi:hypothetical protein
MRKERKTKECTTENLVKRNERRETKTRKYKGKGRRKEREN